MKCGFYIQVSLQKILGHACLVTRGLWISQSLIKLLVLLHTFTSPVLLGNALDFSLFFFLVSVKNLGFRSLAQVDVEFMSDFFFCPCINYISIFLWIHEYCAHTQYTTLALNLLVFLPCGFAGL